MKNRFPMTSALIISLWALPLQGQALLQNSPSFNSPVPPALTLPGGTLITVTVTQTLSSDRNHAGDGFVTVLEQPLVAEGWVVARRGQTVIGRVAVAQKAGRAQGVSQLAAELTELLLVDGQQLPIRTQLMQGSGGTSRAQDAGAIGATSGLGAAIGGIAGGGRGAAIGAVGGAAAAAAGILATRGRRTEIVAETTLTFRLETPLTISTERSQQAFRPVSPEDYADRGALRTLPLREPDSHRHYAVIPAFPPPPYYYFEYYRPGYFTFYRTHRRHWPRTHLIPRPRPHFGRGFRR